MKNYSLKVKLFVLLSAIGVISVLSLFSFEYNRKVDAVFNNARTNAETLIHRSVEMFMVSTRKFHDAFQKSADNPVERKRVIDDWNRTIFAVDEAVIHDYGEDSARVRLIGDKELFNYEPIGKENTQIEIPFESEAGKILLSGKKRVEVIEDGFLRIAVPLWSNAHSGCAECHFSTIETDKVDMNREILLGSLNAYIPINKMLSAAKSGAFITSGLLSIAILLLLGVMFFLINHLVMKPVQTVIRGLKDGSDHVAVVADDISSSSRILAEGSSEQAAAIEETSASLEEISAMTKQNADNANQADLLTNATKDTTQSCSNVMQEMAAAIGQVNESSQTTQKIVKTIDEIAFQTNLLALNAAVEAARAGEAGAGFAVVADEVRNLAMRAAEAAQNTTGQIDDISTKINEAMEMVFKTVDEFAKVDENTSKVSELVSEISSASREQSDGIEQVSRAVTEMDKVVQQNAANAEESASASEEMDSQAEQISKLVHNLVKLVGDGKIDFTATDSRKREQTNELEYNKTDNNRTVKVALDKNMVNPDSLLPLDDSILKDF